MRSPASAAAALVLALLACKQEKDAEPVAASSATSSGAAPATPGSAKPKPKLPGRGKPRNITAEAVTGIRSTSAHEKHPAEHLIDGKPNTAWQEISPSDGQGHWVEVTLNLDTYVSHVEVSGGWGAETRFGEDLWELNNSVRVMRVSWDDGEQIVRFKRGLDRGKLKRVEIGQKITLLRITAEEVDRGKHDDLAVNELALFGETGWMPAK